MRHEQNPRSEQTKADELAPEVGSISIKGFDRPDPNRDTSEDPTIEIPISELIYAEHQPGLDAENPNIIPGDI